MYIYLCDNSLAILPIGGDLLGSFVVAGEAVDAAFDEDEAELGVLVLAITVEMLADVDGLLDEHVEVLGHVGGEPVGAEDAQDLVSCHLAHLSHAV